MQMVIDWLILGVTGERQLFESCKSNLQCKGTENAGTCRKIANHSFCFCNEGHVEYQGRCIEGTVVLTCYVFSKINIYTASLMIEWLII